MTNLRKKSLNVHNIYPMQVQEINIILLYLNLLIILIENVNALTVEEIVLSIDVVGVSHVNRFGLFESLSLFLFHLSDPYNL